MIKLIDSKEIDKYKWDQVVTSDPDFRLYSLSWMLDAVSENGWKGAVIDDYKIVLPVVIGSKWGISYCHMPYFIQQYSVIEEKKHVPALIDFLKAHCSYGQLSVRGTAYHSSVSQYQRSNFELRLDKTYQEIRSNYSSNHRTNLKRFDKGQLDIVESKDISMLVQLMKEEKKGEFTNKEMNKILVNICRIHIASKSKGNARLYYAMDGGKVSGGAFFVECGNRLYYLLGISRRKTASKGIAYGLLDYVINLYSGKNFILDFEGSQIDTIQYFFRGFGSIDVPYTLFKWNELPFFMKWVKK